MILSKRRFRFLKDFCFVRWPPCHGRRTSERPVWFYQRAVSCCQRTESPQVPTRSNATVGSPFGCGFECSTAALASSSADHMSSSFCSTSKFPQADGSASEERASFRGRDTIWISVSVGTFGGFVFVPGPTQHLTHFPTTGSLISSQNHLRR